MITIKGNLVLKEDYSVDEDLIVEGNITCEGGLWDIDALNIKANNIDVWDIDALNIDALNIKANNIDVWDIDALNINANNIDALNINANNIYANNIDALNINYYAVCFSYYSIKCNSIKGRRNNSKHFCLDKEIEITKKVCETCGKEL
jgi:hypothetical protein